MTNKKPSLKDIETFAQNRVEQKQEEQEPQTKPIIKQTMQKEPIKNKKIGRPSLKSNRTEKIFFFTTAEIAKRVETAFLKTKIQWTEKDKKLDKSLFIENIITQFLDKNSL